jgi:hypothetical protein
MFSRWSARVSSLVVALLLFVSWPTETPAYAVLSHEAIIDVAWDTNIRPLLLKRFPNATPEELKDAHRVVPLSRTWDTTRTEAFSSAI